MKLYTIKITDTDVYINGELQHFAMPMDKENHEDDLNKKAILAIAGEMGYEATFLFEEMADRLWEMLDEPNEEENLIMTNEQKRWDALPDIDNETVKTWLDSLLEDKSKMFVEELTIEEIQEEIEETKGSIDNFSMWGDRHAIIDCEEYIEILEELLKRVSK